jgi:hypothetical protein
LVLAAALGGCTINTSSMTGVRDATEPARLESMAAVEPGDPNSTAVEYRDWEYHGAQGRVISTPRFEVYTTLRRQRTLQYIPVFYERCFKHYVTALGPLPSPDRKLVSFIFSDGRQWKNKTREMLPDQADAFMSLGRGGFTTRGTSVLFYIGYRDTWAIAAHEGWHQYTQTTFKHPLPVWLEEGIAAYMEAIAQTSGRRLLPWLNEERRDALREAENDGKLIPLQELLHRSPQAFLRQGRDRLLTYYAQVWALARFLAEGEGGRYRPALETLLSDAAYGRLAGRLAASKVAGLDRRGVLQKSRNGPAILLEYFNSDLSEFEYEFDQYVRRLTRNNGRRHASAGEE